MYAVFSSVMMMIIITPVIVVIIIMLEWPQVSDVSVSGLRFPRQLWFQYLGLWFLTTPNICFNILFFTAHTTRAVIGDYSTFNRWVVLNNGGLSSLSSVCVRYSEGSIFRRFDIPRVRYSEASIFRRFDIPKLPTRDNRNYYVPVALLWSKFIYYWCIVGLLPN
jgi:hypothetical protein